MPMSTAGQGELAIRGFRAVVLLCLGGMVVGMRVGMRFLEMLFNAIVLMMLMVLRM